MREVNSVSPEPLRAMHYVVGVSREDGSSDGHVLIEEACFFLQLSGLGRFFKKKKSHGNGSGLSGKELVQNSDS